MRLSIALEGGERVDVRLSRFTEYLRDLRPFWRETFAPKFFGDAVDNIDKRGRYVGGWKPLSPAYAEWKRRHYPGRPIMQLRFDLRASLVAIGRRFNVFRPTATGLEIGTSVPYAIYHQLGTRRMPQRRILWLASSETYGRMLHRWAVEQRKRAQFADGGTSNTSLPPLGIAFGSRGML